MTDLASAIFDEGWQARQGGINYGDLQWVATGERLNADTFVQYRKKGGMVVVHSIPEEMVRLAMSNPIDRRESVVALMEAGDLFGELGLLDDGPRSAMARALEPSELIEVPFDPVREMFDADPRLLRNVTRLLAARPRVPRARRGR